MKRICIFWLNLERVRVVRDGLLTQSSKVVVVVVVGE